MSKPKVKKRGAKKKVSDSEILLVIDDYKTKHDMPPTIRELSARTPYSGTGGIYARIRKLEEQGFLKRIPKVARSIRLTEQGLAMLKKKHSVQSLAVAV